MTPVTFWDWLSSPIGLDVSHAIIVLLLAIASWLSYKAERTASANARLLNGHLDDHLWQAATAGAPQPTAPRRRVRQARRTVAQHLAEGTEPDHNGL